MLDLTMLMLTVRWPMVICTRDPSFSLGIVTATVMPEGGVMLMINGGMVWVNNAKKVYVMVRSMFKMSFVWYTACTFVEKPTGQRAKWAVHRPSYQRVNCGVWISSVSRVLLACWRTWKTGNPRIYRPQGFWCYTTYWPIHYTRDGKIFVWFSWHTSSEILYSVL